MKILFVAYYNPLGNGGFEKQARGLFKTLLNNNHQIACLCVNQSETHPEFVRQLKDSALFNGGIYVLENCQKAYSFSSKILFWFHQRPARYLASQSPHLQRQFEIAFEQINLEFQPDVVHCLGLKTLYFLPKNPALPIVADLVDSKTQYKKRAVIYYWHNSFKKIVTGTIDLYKTWKLEKDILSAYLKYPVAVVSKKDANVLKKICDRSLVHTVCHPVAINRLDRDKSQLIAQNNERHTLIFYGFMDYVNADALFYLANQILPIVSQKFPQIVLKITGYNLSPKIHELASKKSHIEIIENIEDISSFLDRATVTCWPFRYGSGVKNKIIESMYLSKPVVTTTIGAEAFTEEQKKGMLIADKPEDLAKGIIDLLQNPDECLRLGAINHQIVTRDFTWEQKARDYLKLYQMAQKQHSNLKPAVAI